MGDIDSLISSKSKTVAAIYDWHKTRGDKEPVRTYLGASTIGKECERELWYGFRWCSAEDFSGRMYRLFQTGHLEEPRIVEELEGIGCEVIATDENGGQIGVKSIGGHFAGHMDGVVRGVPEAPKTWHLLECKTFGGTETQNSKDFEKVKKEGVKIAKPIPYAQMQTYMGENGLTRALYIGKKKATDELYSERIEIDPDYYKGVMEKAERIIRSSLPPERCTDRADDFRCKFCAASDLCWGRGEKALTLPAKSCRTCCHATPEIDEGETWGRWSCSKHEKNLSKSDQIAACSDHLVLPALITFAEVSDAGDEFIEFTNIVDKRDRAVWRHGKGAGLWSTDELLKSPASLVGSKPIESVKKVFDATVEKWKEG